MVLAAATAAVRTDAALVGVYGPHMRLAGSGTHQVPLLEWQLIGDSEGELWAPCTVQFDQWCPTMDALRMSERRLRFLFHLEVPGVVQGLGMWSEFQDGAWLASPDRDQVFGRALRFRMTPLRDRYDALQVPPS